MTVLKRKQKIEKPEVEQEVEQEINPQITEEDPKQEAKDFGFETYIEGKDQFLPDKMEDGKWRLKVREVSTLFDQNWMKGLTVGLGMKVYIRTGIEVNKLFKTPIRIDPLFEHVREYETWFFQTIAEDPATRELVITMRCDAGRNSLRCFQGEDMADICFIKQ